MPTENPMAGLKGKARCLGVTLALLIAAFLCWLALGGTLAWFAHNKTVKAGGLRIEASDGGLAFCGAIRVEPAVGTATLPALVYMLHNDGGYYEVQPTEEGNGLEAAGELDGTAYSFALDSDGNRIPIQLTGLFPGETLTVTVTFRNTQNKARNYRLALEDFDDTDGQFTIPEGTTAGEVNTPGTYSIMGIFRVETLGVAFSDGSTAGTAGAHSGGYLANFNTADGRSDVTEDPFVLAEGTLPADSDTVSCTFRISVDLTGYYTLRGTVTNMLSKKALGIGALRLSAAD